ncbi:MAG: nucleotidyltransferase domain-containing protein [Nanoarchaeota archaeon]|nr:nucleotidyltransferase domain-containing protein [Nanoarchaeota archaeon]
MLKIFNDLEPFFRDNYRRIGVREYSRERRISAPTASKQLARLLKEGLLEREKERNYILYVANKESPVLIHLSRLYWFQRLKDAGLIEYLNQEFVNPLIVMFGSFSKAEVKGDSDIDLALFSVTKKKACLETYERKLKRSIHIFMYMQPDEVAQDLLINMQNGFILSGGW